MTQTKPAPRIAITYCSMCNWMLRSAWLGQELLSTFGQDLGEVALIPRTGGIFQMLNHGISTPALFLLVGMLYERRHTKEIKEYGGITKVMPLFAVAFMIATLSSVALPGTNGFVGEFLILLGTWKANPALAVLATTGVIFGAVYMLWMFQRVMFGPLDNPENKKLKDLSPREAFVLLPLMVAIVVMGVVPNFFFEKMETSVNKLLERTGKLEMVAKNQSRKDEN